MGGQKQPAAAEEFTKEFARDMDHILRGVDGGDWTFQYVDDMDFEGTAAHRVVIRDRFERSTTVYLSAENGRVVGRRFVGETMSGPGELTEVVREWADYDGIPGPALVTISLEGEDYMSIAFSEYVLDGDVDMAIFDKGE